MRLAYRCPVPGPDRGLVFIERARHQARSAPDIENILKGLSEPVQDLLVSLGIVTDDSKCIAL